MSPALVGRLRRLEQSCRAGELIWIGEIFAELMQERERYANRDARFSPRKIVELVGELCIRSDAIRNDTGCVPQLFIRGSQADKLSTIGAARLVGLGCGVQVRQQSVLLTAYLQDPSGTVVAVCENFAVSGEDGNEPSFWQLAQKPVFKQVSLAALGAGQMLIQGGKRSPDYQFLPGRKPIAVSSQMFDWESLRSPLLVEDFHLLQMHSSLQPPASLRPRRLTENFHVFAISQVGNVKFSQDEQVVEAILEDSDRHQAILKFPYNSRSQEGTEALLEYLENRQLLFVAGQIYLSTEGLIITPVSLVFQTGETRTILQPWIHGLQSNSDQSDISTSRILPTNSTSHSPTPNPISLFLEQLLFALSELLLIGLERVDQDTVLTWQKTSDYGKSLGFTSFIDPINQLLALLGKKQSNENWNLQLSTQLVLEICILVNLAQEQN